MMEQALQHGSDCQCQTCLLRRKGGECGNCTISKPAHAHSHEHEHEEAGEHEHEHGEAERSDLLWLGAALLLFLAALLPGLFFPAFSGSVFQIILYAASVLTAGWELFWDALKSIARFRFDESVLLLIAAAASFVLGEYPEACIVTILFRLGEYLEAAAVARSKKSMEALTEIRPDYAFVKNAAGGFDSLPAESVQAGDEIWLRAGDRAALDCEILEGGSSVDASALTGEAVPVNVRTGDTILSGSLNLSGLLRCRAAKSFENSAASQIVSLVYDSVKKKGKTENFITRFSRVYTPAVIVIALLIAVVPPLAGWGSWPDFINRALIFLMASCPCALVISVPLSFFAAIGASARLGVLVKGSKYIELLAKTKAVCLDKTGTLTSGRLTVDQAVSVSAYGGDEIAALAAAMEQGSTHPLAAAVAERARGLEIPAVSNVAELAGLGVSARRNGHELLCGGLNLLREMKIDRGGLPEANIYLCEDGKIIGYLTLTEEISGENQDLVARLGREGVQAVVMLTGDNEKNAAVIAEKYGVTEYRAGLLPADKVTAVEEVKKRGLSTLFVGDGINDAPVIAAADLGASMGLGSEIANASSDLILAGNSLSVLPDAIRLAKRSIRIVRFNIGFALAVKLVVLVLGAAGLGTIGLAVFADIGVTLLSVLNALRIMPALSRGKPPAEAD